MSSDKERIHRWITQAELERMLADAYRKGAEAMREAAAFHIKDNIVGDQASMILAARVYEKEIRDLPIPESKR
jgi:hypothetical protein